MQTKSIRYQWHILILALALVSSGCAAVINANTDTAVAAPPKIGGPWFVEYIGSRPVIDRSPANFLFDDNGQVSGNASCNQFTGSYEASDSALAFGLLATTRRACFEALGEQEQRFLATVPLVAKWGIKQGLLELYDVDGEMLIRAARHTSTTITGSASYRQRIAMPAGAVFTAVLLDVSKMDVAATTIASTIIENPGNVPIDFEINFDPAMIDERMRYSVRAEIRVNGSLWATTDTHYPVLTHGAGNSVEMVLQLTR
jgi:putative lipoprotein